MHSKYILYSIFFITIFSCSKDTVVDETMLVGYTWRGRRVLVVYKKGDAKYLEQHSCDQYQQFIFYNDGRFDHARGTQGLLKCKNSYFLVEGNWAQDRKGKFSFKLDPNKHLQTLAIKDFYLVNINGYETLKVEYYDDDPTSNVKYYVFEFDRPNNVE